MASERDAAELRMGSTSFYCEETFTDRRLGALPPTFEIEAASPVIIPDRVPPGLGGPGGPRGNGNIQLP